VIHRASLRAGGSGNHVGNRDGQRGKLRLERIRHCWAACSRSERPSLRTRAAASRTRPTHLRSCLRLMAHGKASKVPVAGSSRKLPRASGMPAQVLLIQKPLALAKSVSDAAESALSAKATEGRQRRSERKGRRALDQYDEGAKRFCSDGCLQFRNRAWGRCLPTAGSLIAQADRSVAVNQGQRPKRHDLRLHAMVEPRE